MCVCRQGAPMWLLPMMHWVSLYRLPGPAPRHQTWDPLGPSPTNLQPRHQSWYPSPIPLLVTSGGHHRVPTRTGKPGKMGRHFPVREKSGNFEQTGKVREKSGKITQNTGKLREFQTNIIFYFLVIFKLTVYYFAEMHQIFSYKINF